MEESRPASGILLALPPGFKDRRGLIQNLVELPAGEGACGVAIITTRARTTRSNHYHKTDAHWLYVLSGEMHYFERAVGAAEYPPPLVCKAGALVYTGPMLEHRTYFPEDTVLVSIAKNPRDHEGHEDDVVRTEAVCA